jgi:hypothetical protein
MRRLSNKRRAADEVELRLWAKREVLRCLVTEREVRQDTIDRLRSTKEMAMHERSGMRRDDNDIFLYLALPVVLLG